MKTRPSPRDDSNPGRIIAQGAGINMLGEIFAVTGAPLLYLVISHTLGAQMLGTYVLVVYYISLAFRLAVLGFDKGVMRHIPKARATDEPIASEVRVLGTAIKWTGAIAILLAIVISLFSDTLLLMGGDQTAQDASFLLAILVFALPAQVFSRVALFALRGLSIMWAYVAVANVIEPLSLVIASAVPILFGLGIKSLTIGYLASAWIAAIVSFVLLKRFFSNHSTAEVLRARTDWELTSFSWPQGFTEMLNFLLARLDIIMVGAFFPDKPELIAFYGMASLIAGVVKKVRFSFDNSFSPIIADLHARGEHRHLNEQYKKVGRWILALFVLVGFSIALASKFILSLYGAEFVDYWLAVPILIGGRFLNAAGGTAQSALLMSGRSKLELANNILINLANVGLNLILIPRYHVFGAAIATAASLTFFNIARIIEVSTLLRLKVSGVAAIRITLAGTLAALPGMGVLALSGSALASLASGVSFLIIYPFVLYLLGNREDVRTALKTIERRLSTWKRSDSKCRDNG